ncbi:MAG: hypothetical protein J5926_02640, partial [Ruminococcus sp.]|nr:hypothetical protein [Ruminococcus sp.]
VRIFRHNFVGDKAKIRRRAVALQGFLTQSPAKFDEKTCMNPYVDRFLYNKMPPQQYGGKWGIYMLKVYLDYFFTLKAPICG